MVKTGKKKNTETMYLFNYHSLTLKYDKINV